MRRLLILSALWLPINLGLLLFSLTNLTNYPRKATVSSLLVNDLFVENNSYARSVTNISPAQDIRIVILRQFLQEYRSPLVDYVEELVKQADLWGLDYALLPAIALQESGGCKAVPADSFNCWGYGIYGAKVTRFNSYPEAIAQIAKTIREAYINRDLSNPTLLEDKWAPPSRGQWSYAVNFFIGKIREYEKNIPAS